MGTYNVHLMDGFYMQCKDYVIKCYLTGNGDASCLSFLFKIQCPGYRKGSVSSRPFMALNYDSFINNL